VTRGGNRRTPPSGIVPVTVPGDAILTRTPTLAVWAGAVTVYPEGFVFTLLTLFDRRRTKPPADWAMDVPERDRRSWLEVRYADGRARAADLNANTPRDQPKGPHLRMLNGEASQWPEGEDESRWWVTPLPPPGPVELVLHLNGDAGPVVSGRLDGAALAEAAAQAHAAWPG
jgi:hypothetical protein